MSYDFDVPIPDALAQPYSYERMQMEAMPVGASMFFENATMRQLLNAGRRLRPMTFTMRQSVEGADRRIGVRVWRLPDGEKSAQALRGAMRGTRQ